MNPIELEWQHLKKDQLSGQMFDDELDLAYAVMNGLKLGASNLSTKRIKFNYHCWVKFYIVIIFQLT